MITTMVPREEIRNVWPTVEPLLQAAVDKDSFREDITDIFTDILLGTRTLWVVLDSETKSIVTACVFRIVQFGKGNVMFVEYLGGDRLDEWCASAMETAKAYAKDMGCICVEVVGRDGWQKPLEKIGGKKVATVIRMEL